ncbi:MAG TPA: phosphatase PAP2 family protein [Noviherbaspirillum sp.]
MKIFSRRRLAFWHLVVPLLLAPLIWWILAATDIDRALIAWYYDADRHGFPLRDDPFMAGVMHAGMKLLVIALGMAVAGAFLFSYVVPQLAPYRRDLLWLFAGMAGAALLVSIVKHNSTLHCPWDLADYGGYAPFRSLFDNVPDDTAPGRCFPGGHASGGFALIAFYFALRDRDLRHARLMLGVGLAMGTIMGWSQMMRGAHFLSHTVWSAWLEWMYLAALYHLVPPHQERAAASGAALS